MSPPKKLQPQSRYEEWDLNNDGIITDDEVRQHQEIVEVELREEKADAQRNMCWLALLGMLLYPSLVVFCDMLGLDKAASVLGDMSSIYFVSVGGLISVWFGSVAYTSTKNGNSK